MKIGLYSTDDTVHADMKDALKHHALLHLYEQVDDAMEAYDLGIPRVLIIDVLYSSAPEGFGLCKKIRNRTHQSGFPLFALCRNTPRSISLALAAGFTDCIFWPMNGDLLFRRLQQASEAYDAHRDAWRYRSLMQHSNDAVIITSSDDAHRVKVWNRAAERVYGYTASDVLGKNLNPIVNTEYFEDEETLQASEHVKQSYFWQGEVIQKNRDDDRLRIASSVAAVTNDAGNIVEYLAINRDITQQHAEDTSVRISQDRLQTILDVVPELILILDREGRHQHILTENHPALLRPADELIASDLYDLMDKTQADAVIEAISHALETGDPATLDYQVKINGDSRWFSAEVTAMDDERVAWVARDITAQRQAEQALQDSANSYRHLFEAANDAIFLVDVETGQIIEANRQTSRLLGYTNSELIGMPIDDVEISTDSNHNDTLTATMNNTNRIIFEQQYRHKNGNSIPVESSSRITRHQGRLCILSFARNISERRMAEASEREQRLLAEALRDTAAAFNSTLEHDEVLDLVLENVDRVIESEGSDIFLIGEDGYATIRRHRGYMEAGFSEAAMKTVRLEVATTRNLRWMRDNQQALYIPDIRYYDGWQDSSPSEWIRSILSAPIVIKGEVAGFINLLSSQPGAFTSPHVERLQAFANQAAIAIHNAALFESTQRFAIEKEREVIDRTTALAEANQSLTEQMHEREQAETALQEERNLLRTLIDNLPDQIFVKDTESRFILANRAVVTNLGLYSVDDLIGKTDIDLNISDALALYEEEQTLILSGQSLVNSESEGLDKRGERRFHLSTKLPLHDGQGNIIGLVGINRDITKIKRAEERLEQERNLLRVLIDTIPDLIYIKDRESRFLLANRAMLEAVGAAKIDDVAGMTDFDFYPKTQAAEQQVIERRLLDDGMAIMNQNVSFVDSQGNQHAYLMNKLALRDAEDTITGLIGVHRDISELRQAEEQLSQVLDSARCLLWFAIVEETSEAYEWQHMYVANEDAAATFLPVAASDENYTAAWLASILPEDATKRRILFQTQLRYDRADYSMELRCKDESGRIRWLVEDVQIRQLLPGRWRLVGVCTDITERKIAEESLQQAHDLLEERVIARTRELLQANDSLKQEINERRRAEESEREQRILAEALRDTSVAINRQLSFEEALDDVLGALRRVIPYDAASIYLLDNDMLRIAWHRGFNRTMDTFKGPITTFSNLVKIQRTGEAYLIADTSSDSEWHQLPGQEWIRCNMAVPIYLDDVVIGFLSMYSRQPNRFNSGQAEWLRGFASQVSTAVRNERLMSEIRRHAADLEARVTARTTDLAQKRAELEAILNAMRDGVVYYDLEGNAQYTNQAMSEITGYSSADWLSGKAELALLSHLEEKRTEILDKRGARILDRQGFWQVDMLLQRQDEGLFDAGITCAEVRDADGERIGVVMVLRDVSESKELEAQKKQFIARASHELRTPIANMKTRLYLMRKQQDKFAEHIEVAESVVNWMRYLVETMFDISRFEQGIIELRHENFPLQDLLIDVLNDHLPAAGEKDVKLAQKTDQTDATCYADRQRLRQVLSNLVSNAVNYTPAGGNVWLAVEQTSTDIFIRVIDDGNGIEEKDIEHLFEPFYRAESDTKGAGLGLSIAHDIIKGHGGDLRVESTVNEGSTFIIRLPVPEIELEVPQ